MLKRDGTLVLSNKSVLQNDKKRKLAASAPTLKTIDQHSWCLEVATQAKILGTTLMSRNVHTESGK